MRRRTRGIINAALLIGLFVMLPRVILSMLPAELLRMLSMGGMDIGMVILGLTIPGLALTLLALMGGFVEPRSPISLVTAISSHLVWFYIFLFTIGIGNPWTFGQSQITGGGGPAAITFILDSRFFIAFATLILGFKIVKIGFEHLSLRRQSSAQTSPQAEIPMGSEAIKEP